MEAQFLIAGFGGQGVLLIGQLLAMRNVYFVPFAQDDPKGKPNSLVARFEMLPETVKSALEGLQIQPLLRWL